MLALLTVAWAGPMPTDTPATPVVRDPLVDGAFFLVFAVLLACIAWWADRPLRRERKDG